MELEKIKTCPFCGRLPSVVENFPVEGLHIIACEHKECKVKPHTVGKTPDETIKRWNVRN